LLNFFYDVIMKKQIFTIMMSTLIFVATPLFAMNGKEEQDKQRRHQGRGMLSILPNDDLLIEVAKKTDIPSLYIFSGISKEMQFFCQNPKLWSFMVIRLLPDLSEEEKAGIGKMPLETVKTLAKSSFQKYGSLFNKDDKNEKMSMDAFFYFIRKPVPFSCGTKFETRIGDKTIILEESLHKDIKNPYAFNRFFQAITLQDYHFNIEEITNKLKKGETPPMPSMEIDDTLFKHPVLSRLNDTSWIFLAAQPGQKCYLVNFIFLLNKKATIAGISKSSEICDRWVADEQSPGQLVLKDEQLCRQDVDRIAQTMFDSQEGGSMTQHEASFKLYEKSKDPQ
jgi:hypothetical protein